MIEIVSVLSLAAMLVAGAFYLHYSALRLGARLVVRNGHTSRRSLLLVLALVFLTHLAEVLLFAFAYYAMHWSAWLGSLANASPDDPSAFTLYFYFSITTYTTLGVGDIVPLGPLRIIAGIEALTGLVLIAWSASFTYLMMERLWSVGDRR